MKMTNKILIAAVLVASTAGLSACSDILSFDTEAPGRIADGDLNTPDAIPGLVAGMSYDLVQAIDGILQPANLAGGELWHGGSYDFGTYPRGILLQSPEDWDGEYGTMSQARWVAEEGLRRMAGVLEEGGGFERNPHVARAYLLGGFANRMLGELQCTGTVDGGPEVPHTEYFTRADSMFSRAIQVGGAAGVSDIVTAGYGGRASVRAWLGNWGPAVADAAQVPPGFQYDAIFSTNVGAVSNDLVFETTSRKEFTVFSTMWVPVTDDARVPWQIVYDASGQVEVGQDGETPFYQQLKYLDQDADVELTKGTEMLVLRAEERLRGGDIPGMVGFLNQARDVYGMDHVTAPTTTADAWEMMRFERYATLWMTGRRLHDMRRWDELGGAAADPFAVGRDLCFPISDEERRVNPNL